MKKLLLPLLLILSFSFLAAVESDPSAVVGYVKYDLVAGNNMVAIPMTCSWATAGALGDSFGTDPGTGAAIVDQVSYWDAASQFFISAVEFGGYWEDDFAITTGNVLMLNSYAAATMYSAGTLPPPATYNLVAGNNTLMVPLNKSSITMAGALGDEMVAGGVDQISYWDAASQFFITAVEFGGYWEDDFTIGIAMPLMANAYTPITWPARGLGSVSTPSRARN